MNVEFELQSPNNLWQDFGIQQNSNIETTIFNIERLVSKNKNRMNSFSIDPIKFRKHFIFQNVTYQIQYIHIENLVKDVNGVEILPFAESDSVFKTLHLLYDINDSFFEISQINNDNPENAANLSRFLAQASVFKDFPIFVRISHDGCQFYYIGNKFGLGYQIKYNFVISPNSEIHTIPQLRNRIKQLNKTPSRVDNFKPILTRLIYHILYENDIFILICGEWPKANFSAFEMDLNHSSRIILSIEETPDAYSEFNNAFTICENHQDTFNFITLPKHITDGLDENSFEWEGFNGTVKKMSIDINYIPSNTILTKLANHLLVQFDKYPNFDTCWKYFLAYIQSCIKKQEDIQLVDLESIDHSNCLIYQKLVLINICLHKLKLGIKTSNFVLTSDMIQLIDRNIIKEYSKVVADNEIDAKMICMMRNKVLEAKSVGRQTLDSFLKNKTGTIKVLAKIAWEVIPPSYFDLKFLIEYALDYLEGLSMFDILKSLLFILLCEKYNDAGSLTNQITQLLNSLRSEMDLLSITEFVQRSKRIDLLITKLHHSNCIRQLLKISKSFSLCPLLIEKLLRDRIVVAETPVERDAIKSYLNSVTHQSAVEISKDKQYIVIDSFVQHNVKVSLRTVLIDKDDNTSICASSITEEFISS